MDFLFSNLIWILNLVSTWFMVGLIWFVQIVHYPLHGLVSGERFREYQEKHMLWTTYVVAVPMLCEAFTAGYLAYYPPNFGSVYLWIIGFLLVVINILSTYLFQRPAHESLLNSFKPDIHQFLVNTNWIRTIAWSLRGVLWIYLLYKGT